MDLAIKKIRNNVYLIQNFALKKAIKDFFGMISLNHVFRAQAIAHHA